MIWTQVEIDAIHAGYEAGKSYGVIAAEIGRPRNSVIGKARRLGLIGLRRPEQCGKPRQPKESLPRIPRDDKPPKPKWALLRSAHVLPIQMNPTTLLDLQAGQCRFFLGDINDEATADAMFCGAKAMDGSSYCEHHHARIWQPYKRKKGHRPKKVDHAQFIYGVAA
jgi:hypothetical protein